MTTRNRAILVTAFLAATFVVAACKKAEPPAPPPEPTAAPVPTAKPGSCFPSGAVNPG